jgi:hypothetical protein
VTAHPVEASAAGTGSITSATLTFAPDEEQASAGARSAPPALLRPWKGSSDALTTLSMPSGRAPWTASARRVLLDAAQRRRASFAAAPTAEPASWPRAIDLAWTISSLRPTPGSPRLTLRGSRSGARWRRRVPGQRRGVFRTLPCRGRSRRRRGLGCAPARRPRGFAGPSTRARARTARRGDAGVGSRAAPPRCRLHALDARLTVGLRAGRRELERALAGHVLATAELMGRCERRT